MIAAQPADAGVEEFLRRNEEKELLRFTTAGSVDDGKSTLIGRLLYDSKGIYEDQLASIRKASNGRNAGAIDFSLLTDGLRAEREQGITIDVAYRYFSTPRRKFIIADTPGHEQYTRNMATGASTANLAVVLVDARKGVLRQSRRHAYIASLLGIPHVVVAVNKMDLVGYSREVFERIVAEFTAFARQLELRDLRFLPLSALEGENVVSRGSRMPWFDGPSLLEYLETVPIARDLNHDDLRFPVQHVIRPNQDFRGYAGQVASGVIRPGDAVMALPSGRTTRVQSIATYDGNLSEAFPPMSVTLCLEDDIDVGRGDMLVLPQSLPRVDRRFEAMLVWMDDRALEPGRTYLARHTTQQVNARVTTVLYKLDADSLAKLPADGLELNEIGRVAMETHKPLFFDAYGSNRATGSFVLIDPISNATVAAGMILPANPAQPSDRRPQAKEFTAERVAAAERHARNGHLPGVVSLAAGSELGAALERRLFDRGCHALYLETAAGPHVEAAAGAALAAGLIVILRGAGALAMERLLSVDEAMLPADTESAVEAICRKLEGLGVLPATERLSDGEGI